MLVFPNAKINIGLHVVDQRPDGYHNLETVFYPIALADALEIVASEKMRFSSSGLTVPGDEGQNLCEKAYDIVKRNGYAVPNVHIHLHKSIPIGAGLGGGSADAAFTLKALNEAFDLGISYHEMLEMASAIGSDCAFFISNKASKAVGKGTELSPIAISLQGMYMILVHPGIHVSTSEAYKNVKKRGKSMGLFDAVSKDISLWRSEVENDFEPSVFEKYPEVANIKAKMYTAGAVYASMSGSGSAVFGLFQQKTSLSWPSHYFVYQSALA